MERKEAKEKVLNLLNGGLFARNIGMKLGITRRTVTKARQYLRTKHYWREAAFNRMVETVMHADEKIKVEE